jgi:ComF family protein
LSWWRILRGELRSCCNLLLPPACLLCGKSLPDSAPAWAFCPACHAGLPRPATSRCPVCAAAFRSLTPSRHHCETCLRHPPPFARVHAVGPYAGTLQEAVQRFKYHGHLALERPLGHLLATAVRSAAVPRPHLLIPVPLHIDRLRSRGYNQALQLARQIGREVGLPIAADLLRRTRATAPQQGLDAAARHSNLQGAFAAMQPLNGRRILLVDDVMTTGATTRECAGVLRKAGAVSVEIAVVGRA